MDLFKELEELHRQPADDRITRIRLADPVYQIFQRIPELKAAIEATKRETLSNVWARENHGKVEIVPLDDDFKELQARISEQEAKLVKIQKTVDSLAHFWDGQSIDVMSLHEIDTQRHNLLEQIKDVEYNMQLEILPYARAAAVLKQDCNQNETVIQIKASAEERKVRLNDKLSMLDGWLASINAILAKVEL